MPVHSSMVRPLLCPTVCSPAEGGSQRKLRPLAAGGSQRKLLPLAAGGSQRKLLPLPDLLRGHRTEDDTLRGRVCAVLEPLTPSLKTGDRGLSQVKGMLPRKNAVSNPIEVPHDGRPVH